MEFDILAKLEEVDFAPADVYLEVAQNVKTILTTLKYSVPLDRNFGLNAVMLDKPMPRARAKLQAEIYNAIRKYEPRCKVLKISFEADLDGLLVPKVRIRVNNG